MPAQSIHVCIKRRRKNENFPFRMVRNHTPDLFILDEPTNNLDIPNVEIITTAIKSYQGTLLLVSHDPYFVNEIKINGVIELFSPGSVIKI